MAVVKTSGVVRLVNATVIDGHVGWWCGYVTIRPGTWWVQGRENGSVLCTFSASITTSSTTLYSTSTASLYVYIRLRDEPPEASISSSVMTGNIKHHSAYQRTLIWHILMLFSSSVSYLYLDYGDFLPSLNNKHSIHKVYWSLNPLDEFGFSGFVQNSIRATVCYLLPFPLYLERNPLNV